MLSGTVVPVREESADIEVNRGDALGAGPPEDGVPESGNHAGEESMLSGAPDGGGLGQALAGLSILQVPRARSVLATTASLVVLLTLSSVCIVGIDALLERTLSASPVRVRSIVGIIGLLASLASLGLLLPVALDAPSQPRQLIERRPLRLIAGLGLLLLTAVCALVWSRGVTLR